MAEATVKFYQSINQAPRSAKHHGKHRKASPKAYGDPVVGTDYSTGGSDQGGTVTVSWSRANTISSFDPFEPEAPAIPYAGIRTGEIIGHRFWWVVPVDGAAHLCSLAHCYLWEPGQTIEAKIDRYINAWWFSHVLGGTYAFTSAEHCTPEQARLAESLREFARHRGNPGLSLAGMIYGRILDTTAFVRGTIKMWGDVAEHETGYRAQFAKLNSLDELHGEGDIDELRRRYGVNH